jgi:hypothetical protein
MCEEIKMQLHSIFDSTQLLSNYMIIEMKYTAMYSSQNIGQALKLISGPGPATKTRLFCSNRTQFRVVIDLLTGHNTSRRNLY